MTFDIIRRILEDYFGYEVFSVMNNTDVDDKIILKARRSYLYDKYEKENNQTNEKVFLINFAINNSVSARLLEI